MSFIDPVLDGPFSVPLLAGVAGIKDRTAIVEDPLIESHRHVRRSQIDFIRIIGINIAVALRLNIFQSGCAGDFSDKTEYDHKADEKICLFCFNLLKEHILQFSPKKFKTLSTLQEFACV